MSSEDGRRRSVRRSFPCQTEVLGRAFTPDTETHKCQGYQVIRVSIGVVAQLLGCLGKMKKKKNPKCLKCLTFTSE